MKVLVISYSMTGNNDALAAMLSKELGAEHITIRESRPRTNGTIALDMLLNRTPGVTPTSYRIDDKELIVFAGPVWMGHVAAPLRACFKQLKFRVGPYIFVSISGGALGPNPKLADELKKRVGKEPAAVIDLHIADLLPQDPKPTREVTSSYRLNSNDLRVLTDEILIKIREAVHIGGLH